MNSLTLDRLGAPVRFLEIPGAGRPLVFVHGLGCAASSDYPAVVTQPALSGRRAFLVDLPGHGFSARPAEFGYSVEDHAAVVAELLERLGAAEYDLFGHSMGGSVAIVTASLMLRRISHLVVAEPNLDAGGGVYSRAIAEYSEEGYVARGHAETIREAEAAGNLNWAGTMAVASAVATYRSAMSLVRGGTVSWRARLLALPMEKTWVVGERSLPDADRERLPTAGVRVAVVPNTGHMMMWENAAGLAEAIAEATA
jgi:pimeloyl-ACP methyl ester carboxylesterase